MYRDPDRRMEVHLLVLGVTAAIIPTHSGGCLRLTDMWTLLLAGVGVVMMLQIKGV